MQLAQEYRQQVLGDRSVACQRWRLDSDVAPHTHDFCELAVVITGSAQHATQNGRRRVTAGDAVVVRPGDWHAWVDCGDVEVANLYLVPELFTDELSWVLHDPELARLLLHGGQSIEPVPPVALGQLDGWLAQLAAIGTGRGFADRMLRSALAGCVLATLARGHYTANGPAASATIDDRVRRALQLMTADLAHPWTMAELATGVHLSVSELHRRFRRQVGATPLGWLTRCRAEAIAALLVQSGDTVATIGRRVGWPDPNYASRRFRSVFGISPSGYRRRFGPAA
jgi:AraC family L-rhamnose operon transcriptional activator RhaR